MPAPTCANPIRGNVALVDASPKTVYSSPDTPDTLDESVQRVAHTLDHLHLASPYHLRDSITQAEAMLRSLKRRVRACTAVSAAQGLLCEESIDAAFTLAGLARDLAEACDNLLNAPRNAIPQHARTAHLVLRKLQNLTISEVDSLPGAVLSS
jgi:hypothetical protein